MSQHHNHILSRMSKQHPSHVTAGALIKHWAQFLFIFYGKCLVDSRVSELNGVQRKADADEKYLEFRESVVSSSNLNKHFHPVLPFPNQLSVTFWDNSHKNHGCLFLFLLYFIWRLFILLNLQFLLRFPSWVLK